MKCPDCYWEGNDYLRIFHPCAMHDDLFHVHCNDEDTNRTLCGIWGFNVTEELEDVTCPDGSKGQMVGPADGVDDGCLCKDSEDDEEVPSVSLVSSIAAIGIIALRRRY